MYIVTDPTFEHRHKLHITLGELHGLYLNDFYLHQGNTSYCVFIERLIRECIGKAVYVSGVLYQFNQLAPNVIVHPTMPTFESAIDEHVSIPHMRVNARKFRIALFEFLIENFGADTEMVFTATECNY